MIQQNTKQFKREPDLQNQVVWCTERWSKVYNSWNTRQNTKQFTLHDGPPYANGDIHMGHAVNKVLKDSVNRFMAMKGYKINFIPGWDCHGLPIEAKVEENFKKQGLVTSQIKVHDLRKACKDFAESWIVKQKNSFTKLGVIASEDYYTTMSPEAELSIVELIHKFALKGLLYRDLKPVMWSCTEATALAEAEVIYMMKDSTSIDVAIPISFSHIPELVHEAYIVIWTTTPWTIPANRAIAYNKDLDYLIIKSGERTFVVAKELLSQFKDRTKLDFQIIKQIKGKDLVDTICLHPLYALNLYSHSPLIESDHVTTEQGTGFVHIAPDFGEDDFKLAKRENIPCCHCLDDNGYFLEPAFLKKKFYLDAEADIISVLNENHLILSVCVINHSYPHSWRSRKPLIQRATEQWFIKLDDPANNLRARALEAANSRVKWMPDSAKERFISTLAARSSWCISRQRSWGTPIALFYHKTTGELLLDNKILEDTEAYLSKHGIESWWNESHLILPENMQIDYIAIKDIIDVWFESGATQYFVLQKLGLHPCDLYLEGSDQHRAWFQSSLLQSCVDGTDPPYKAVLTHGYVVDQNKRKMSKSLGNGVSPDEILEQYGPDALRLWVLRQDNTKDITWSMKQIDDVNRMQYKLRNTLKFLITNAEEDPGVGFESLNRLEKWVLHKTYLLQKEADKIDQDWNIYSFMHKVYDFCDRTLSRLYFDIRKDALYWESSDSVLRKQTMHCLHLIFNYLIRWLSPIVPFMADEAWYAYTNSKESIHLGYFLNLHMNWIEDENYKTVEKLFDMRDMVYQVLEPIRNDPQSGIKSGLDSEIVLTCSEENIICKQDIKTLLKSILIVSKLTVETTDITENEEIKIKVRVAEGYKCSKCKHRVNQISENLCIRCSILQ